MGVVKGPDVTIPIDTAVSNVVRSFMKGDGSATQDYTSPRGFMLYAPAALDAHTYIFEVTNDPDATSVVWRELQTYEEPAADLAAALATLNPPLAGKAGVFRLPAYARAWRIKDSSGNVAAARTWETSYIEEEGVL